MAEEKKQTKKKAGRPKKVVETEVIVVDPEISSELTEDEPVKEYIVATKKPGNVLNVRSGAAKDFPVISQLKNGTVVTVYEKENGFGRIGDGQWVMLDLLH